MISTAFGIQDTTLSQKHLIAFQAVLNVGGCSLVDTHMQNQLALCQPVHSDPNPNLEVLGQPGLSAATQTALATTLQPIQQLLQAQVEQGPRHD